MELLAGGFFTVILPLIFLALTTWMSWRIMVKAGFPGPLGLLNITGVIPGIGWFVWIVLLWVFAFIEWPRDAVATARVVYQPPGPLPPGAPALPPGPSVPTALPPQPQRLAPPASAGWTLIGTLPSGAPLRFAFDESRPVVVLGAPSAPADLTIADPSVGAPHARLHVLPGRLGLEDLGTAGGTWIDGARLQPGDGIREITASRELRFGAVTLIVAHA